MFDVHDDIPKWEGYQDKSARMNVGNLSGEEKMAEGLKV